MQPSERPTRPRCRRLPPSAILLGASPPSTRQRLPSTSSSVSRSWAPCVSTEEPQVRTFAAPSRTPAGGLVASRRCAAPDRREGFAGGTWLPASSVARRPRQIAPGRARDVVFVGAAKLTQAPLSDPRWRRGRTRPARIREAGVMLEGVAPCQSNPRHLDAGRLQRRVLAAELYHHAGHASPSAPPRLPVRPLGEYVPRPLMRPTGTSDPGFQAGAHPPAGRPDDSRVGMLLGAESVYELSSDQRVRKPKDDGEAGNHPRQENELPRHDNELVGLRRRRVVEPFDSSPQLLRCAGGTCPAGWN